MIKIFIDFIDSRCHFAVRSPDRYAINSSFDVGPTTPTFKLTTEEKEKNGSTKQLRTETKIKSQWKYKITQNEEVQN